MLSLMDHSATSADENAVATAGGFSMSTPVGPTGPTLQVVTPLPGTVAPLSSVPDPRFASGAFGAGVAVIPDYDNEQVTVVAPVSGELRRLMPHFFLIVTDDGVPVYTQLGIDTDMLDGTGFSPHATEGSRVRVGERITTYAPRQLGRLGFDPLVPVVAMQQERVSVVLVPGEPCEPGDILFEL